MPRISPQQLRVLRAMDQLALAAQQRLDRPPLPRERPGVAVDYGDIQAACRASNKDLDYALKRLEALGYVRKARFPGWALTLAGVIAADEPPAPPDDEQA